MYVCIRESESTYGQLIECVWVETYELWLRRSYKKISRQNGGKLTFAMVMNVIFLDVWTCGCHNNGADWLVWLIGFYDILTTVGYFMPNLVYAYILNIWFENTFCR